MKTQYCHRCESDKPLKEFSRNKSRPNGRSHVCKPCDRDRCRSYETANRNKRSAQRKDWDSNNRERARDTRFRQNLRRRGLSQIAYDAMLVSQNDVCAICNEPETVKRNGITKRLAVDHDHDTDQIRGLLCSKCNTALGLFRDDPALLRDAADYLEQFS
jgi:hypothetical protein